MLARRRIAARRFGSCTAVACGRPLSYRLSQLCALRAEAPRAFRAGTSPYREVVQLRAPLVDQSLRKP